MQEGRIPFSIIILGSAEVGKSSLIKRYFKDAFIDTYTPTNDLDCFTKSVESKSVNVVIDMIDTPGEIKHRVKLSAIPQLVHAFVIVYDVTRPETFREIEVWIQEIANTPSKKAANMWIFANKCDLPQNVTHEEGERLGNVLGVPFKEVSAKDGKGVKEAFAELMQSLL